MSRTTTPNCSKGLGKTGCPGKIQWETENGQPGLWEEEEKITAAVSVPIVHMGWDQIWLMKISNQHWFINSHFHYSKLSDRPGDWAHTLAHCKESQKQPCKAFQLQKEFCLEFMLSQTPRKQTKLSLQQGRLCSLTLTLNWSPLLTLVCCTPIALKCKTLKPKCFRQVENYSLL